MTNNKRQAARTGKNPSKLVAVYNLSSNISDITSHPRHDARRERKSIDTLYDGLP